MNRRTDQPSVQITNLHPKIQVSPTKIRILTKNVLSLLKQKREFHVTFTSDSGIRKINKTFHGANLPTDVLAFEQPRSWSGKLKNEKFLGEVVISIDRAKIYAKRFHVSVDEEVFRYIIHGLLHLLGERDYKPQLKKKMFKRQEAILQKVSPFGQLIKVK